VEIVWSRSADRDVGQIYEFYRSHGQQAARSFLRQLFKAVDNLAEMPRMGAVSEHRTTREYRELVVGHCKLFYYLDEPRLVIVRLWDTRQDPATFFLPRGE
jgi:toxin ParE1/3/4